MKTLSSLKLTKIIVPAIVALVPFGLTALVLVAIYKKYKSKRGK